MSKIRKLYFFDKKKTQEMISFLNNDAYDAYLNNIMFNPFSPLHHFLPLSLKFLPESFILKDEKEIKGLITVAPSKYGYKRFEIQKLLFEENSLSDATELIQYVVSKYKAMGAPSIIVKVDDYLPELLTTFVSKCGFSQISYEKLWRINNVIETPFDKNEYRPFKNSDANAVANLYNNSLLPHFRHLLGKEVNEFKDFIFKGLSYYSEYKYVIEDKKTKSIIGCIIIRTPDNENYVLDIIQTSWADLDINSIISYATSQIKKRKKRFGLFIKTKRYTSLGENYENQFIKNNFSCIQNQIVLTNSSAKILKENALKGKYTILADFLPTKPIPTQCKEL